MARHGHQSRRGVVRVRCGIGERTATSSEHCAAVAGGCCQSRLHAAEGAAVDERTNQGAVDKRVADGQRVVRLGDTLQQLVVDRLMNDQPSQRGAPLTGCAGSRKDDAAHREIQIRRGRYDRRVVATEFQNRPTEAAGNHRSNLATHGGGSRCGHHRHRLVRHQRGTDVGAAKQQLMQSIWRAHICYCDAQQCIAREQQ